MQQGQTGNQNRSLASVDGGLEAAFRPSPSTTCRKHLIATSIHSEDFWDKQLKEAEYILATSIFQARQKLTSFAKATKRPVSSDELIKACAPEKRPSNAICAPTHVATGRPAPATRRTEMRLSFLCNSDLTINGHQNPARQNSLGEINRTGRLAVRG
ncbi:hypothetical protein quinque_014241 [Culex quinquefasciatus]